MDTSHPPAGHPLRLLERRLHPASRPGSPGPHWPDRKMDGNMAGIGGGLRDHRRRCHQWHPHDDQYHTHWPLAVEQRYGERLLAHGRRLDLRQHRLLGGHQRLLPVGQGRRRGRRHPLVDARSRQIQDLGRRRGAPGRHQGMVHRGEGPARAGLPHHRLYRERRARLRDGGAGRAVRAIYVGAGGPGTRDAAKCRGRVQNG